MKAAGIGVAAVAAASVLVGASAVGCSFFKKSSTPSSSTSTSSSTTQTTSPATPAAADYTSLLIKDTDIVAPGDTFTAQPPTQNPNGQPGVTGTFTNQAGSRTIGDTILVLPDADSAAAALQNATGSVGGSVTGGAPGPSPVGTSGTSVSGMSPDGSKAVTVLLFTEGKAFATLEFDSRPDDPVPPDFVNDVGQKQDAAIKNGLPG